MMETATCKAGETINTGDLVCIYQGKQKWFIRFFKWLFRIKPVVYRVTACTDTTVDIHSTFERD
jgi:hypothetical protein